MAYGRMIGGLWCLGGYPWSPAPGYPPVVTSPLPRTNCAPDVGTCGPLWESLERGHGSPIPLASDETMPDTLGDNR